jgi:hypothetical protein
MAAALTASPSIAADALQQALPKLARPKSTSAACLSISRAVSTSTSR